jgi:bifunctional non-homologous end joining protein LigD
LDDGEKLCARHSAAQGRRTPELFTTNARKAERTGRIFIDYLRNDQTASAIAPYSTRAREGAPVAVPLTWRELATLPNAQFYDRLRIAPKG